MKTSAASPGLPPSEARLFNASLDGNVRRAIDSHEGEQVDASPFKALVREAIAHNASAKPKAARKAKP